MKYKLLALLLLLVTSCIEETTPTDVVTEDVVNTSKNTVVSMLRALPGRFNVDGSSTYGHHAFGYGSMMHIRDVQTQDLFVTESDFDQFLAWERNVNLGSNSGFMQYVWNYYYQSIHACNNLIRRVSDITKATDIEKGALAAAYGFRALFYLDLARCYEFLPCDLCPDGRNENGVDVTHLTVPIIDETVTEQQSHNIPRATRQQMYDFILSDLDKAEELIPYLDQSADFSNNHAMPHIYSIYGLKARLYMWIEDYVKAFDYASQAVIQARAVGHYHMYEYIQSGYYTALAQDSQGYASLISSFSTNGMFMWGAVQNSDNATVQTGICNWTSWMNPLALYGYAAAGATSCIDNRLYAAMDKDDWRRLLFMNGIDGYVDGTSVKFDVAGGDYTNPEVSACTTYPIMRIEEMDLIAAEAAAHINPDMGAGALQSYMRSYCNVPNYKYNGDISTESVVSAIIEQKRIELWGEGQSFFDYKRLNMPVKRGYRGTKFAPLTRFNTEGRPAWMNWVIVLNEENTNKAVRGKNNPDHSDKYELWTEM